MRHAKQWVWAAALAAAMAYARPARAQQLDEAALRASKAAMLRGMAALGRPYAGRLASSASARWTVELRAGRSYALAGSCDAGCRDLDLRLLGPDGAEVAADLERDAEPLVRVDPRGSGSYEVRAYMADCRAPSCGFSVQLLAR